MENCSLYGNYAICVEGAIDKTKDCLLEQMFDTIRELAKKDEFWIVKKVSDSNLSCQIAADPDKTYTVAGEKEEKVQPKKEEKPKSTGNPEIDALIKERERALSEMRRLNDAIVDEKISAQIDHLEEVTGKIIDQALELL